MQAQGLLVSIYHQSFLTKAGLSNRFCKLQPRHEQQARHDDRKHFFFEIDHQDVCFEMIRSLITSGEHDIEITQVLLLSKSDPGSYTL